MSQAESVKEETGVADAEQMWRTVFISRRPRSLRSWATL